MAEVARPLAAAGPELDIGAVPLLEVRNLSVRYRVRGRVAGRERPEIVAVDDVSLTITKGEALGLVGGTGSGKSTIARVILGMVKPTSGEVLIDGRTIAEATRGQRAAIRRIVQIVPQDPYSSLDPRMSVHDIIAEPLTGGFPFRGRSRAIVGRVHELLRLVGLPLAKARQHPHQFSGGQRQRIALARALGPKPELIVLDEPTSALDVSVRAQILNLLRAVQEELRVTYLVISHDLVTVAYLASRVAVMHLGRIVELGPTEQLYREPQHPYTLELLSSVPGASGQFLDRSVPLGTREALPATACRFAFRCPLRERLGNPERCEVEDPPLVEVRPGHASACHFPHEVASVGAALGVAGSAESPVASMEVEGSGPSAQPG